MRTNHIVSTENYRHNFLEVDDLSEVVNGVQVHGQADTITDFVQGLRLEEEWIPFGYCLRIVYRQKESNNMTAFLYRIGEKFLA